MDEKTEKVRRVLEERLGSSTSENYIQKHLTLESCENDLEKLNLVQDVVLMLAGVD